MSAQASKSRKTARADTTGGPNEAITIPDDDPTPTNSINKRLKDGYKQRDALIRGNQNQGLGKALSRFEAATGVDAHFILPHMFACMSYLLAPGGHPCTHHLFFHLPALVTTAQQITSYFLACEGTARSREHANVYTRVGTCRSLVVIIAPSVDAQVGCGIVQILRACSTRRSSST